MNQPVPLDLRQRFELLRARGVITAQTFAKLIGVSGTTSRKLLSLVGPTATFPERIELIEKYIKELETGQVVAHRRRPLEGMALEELIQEIHSRGFSVALSPLVK